MRGIFGVIGIFSAWLTLGAETSVARADGGTVRYSGRCGDRLITVFTDPTPPRAGLMDVSVLIQEASSGKPRQDVPVTVQVYLVDHPQEQIRAPATTEAATNKLLRAAQLSLAAGRWHIDVVAEDARRVSSPGFDIDVAEGPPPWIQMSFWIGWPLAVIGLFIVHQFRVRREPRPGLSRLGR
ncbi:MAG TPA: hypothetical protein VG055_01550 [Planctomycetaceae bacterium]|nr:hypothetical protein [Planctomycetaceae bacterium]